MVKFARYQGTESPPKPRVARATLLEIVLVCVIVVLAAVYVRWAYIPSFSDRHVQVSEERLDFDVGEPGPWFSAWSLGDGQAYVLIALDPTGGKLSQEVSAAGYRFIRAGHGWAGWAFSLGRAKWAPHGLAAVGALAIVGTLIATTRLRDVLGPRAWLVLANPALYIGFGGDTSETIGIFFLTVALGWGSMWAAVAVGLSRPTFLVALWGRWRLLAAGGAAAACLAVYGVLSFGAPAMVPPGGALGPPLLGYVAYPSVWGFALLVAAVATVVLGAIRRDWSWVLTGLFIICFGDQVVENPINAWRAAGLLPVLWAFGPGYAESRPAMRSVPESVTT